MQHSCNTPRAGRAEIDLWRIEMVEEIERKVGHTSQALVIR